MPIDRPITYPVKAKATNSAEIGHRIASALDGMARAVLDQQYHNEPETAALGDELAREGALGDTLDNLAHLAEALRRSTPALFLDHIAWTKVMLVARGLPLQSLIGNLNATTQVLRQQLSADGAALACSYIESALGCFADMPAALPSVIAPAQPLAELANLFLADLLGFEKNRACEMILSAVREGASIKAIYIGVFQKTLQEIGRLWQMNNVSIAQEHYCTAAIQMIMSRLYPEISATRRVGRVFVGTSVSGDFHEIGIRMISDFFEMEGWDSVCLGANVPAVDLIQTIQVRQANVVGISATMTPHVARVAEMISAIHAAPGCEEVHILVGGYPFMLAPDLWKKVHADGACESAQGAVDLANRLMLPRKAA